MTWWKKWPNRSCQAESFAMRRRKKGCTSWTPRKSGKENPRKWWFSQQKNMGSTWIYGCSMLFLSNESNGSITVFSTMRVLSVQIVQWLYSFSFPPCISANIFVNGKSENPHFNPGFPRLQVRLARWVAVVSLLAGCSVVISVLYCALLCHFWVDRSPNETVQSFGSW